MKPRFLMRLDAVFPRWNFRSKLRFDRAKIAAKWSHSFKWHCTLYCFVHNCQRSKCFLVGQSIIPSFSDLQYQIIKRKLPFWYKTLTNNYIIYHVTSKPTVSYQNLLHQILWVIYLMQWNTWLDHLNWQQCTGWHLEVRIEITYQYLITIMVTSEQQL